MQNKLRKLNFGSGSIQPEGWVNVDHDGEFQTPIRNIAQLEDNYFDIIVAHAVVQQFEWHDLVNQLKELRRVLKPNGVIRISLPDIVRGFHALARGDRAWFPNTDEKTSDEAFSAWITWYSTSRTLLTIGSLREKLIEAGFRHVRPVEFGKTDSAYTESVELDTRENEFFFMEAIK